MNVFDLMDTKVSGYTKTDRTIYERVKKNPERFAGESYSELVAHLEVSASALTRFAKKLGFNGFNEFQYQLIQDLGQIMNPRPEESMAEKFAVALKGVEEGVDHEQVHRLAKKILAASTVQCLGFNLSSLPAKFLWNSLRNAYEISSEFMEYDYTFISADEKVLTIIFSVSSGEFYHAQLKRLQKEGTADNVVLITMNPKHILRKYCGDVIVLPAAGGVSRTHSAVLENMIFMMFIDRLMTEIRYLKK